MERDADLDSQVNRSSTRKRQLPATRKKRANSGYHLAWFNYWWQRMEQEGKTELEIYRREAATLKSATIMTKFLSNGCNRTVPEQNGGILGAELEDSCMMHNRIYLDANVASSPAKKSKLELANLNKSSTH